MLKLFKKSATNELMIAEPKADLKGKTVNEVIEEIHETFYSEVDKTNPFKEQMINDIIPFVEKMIEKEKNHLYWLESKNAPKEFIEKSKSHLNHFRQRHKEYIEYLEAL